MERVVFFVLAAIALVAGVGVIAQRSAVRSALFLLVTLCCLAGLYLLLSAQFVAMVQVIVYAGAVVVLFLFVVMLLGMERAEETRNGRRYGWGEGVVGALLGALLLGGMVWALIATPVAPAAAVSGEDVRQIGAALLTDLAVPFELVSVVLLTAIVGAVVLARKRVGR